MEHAVVHFEIGGVGGEELAGFYRGLFGWDVQASGPDYWLVAAQSPGIGGGLMQIREDMPSYVTVYVATDDLAASLERAVDLGGVVAVPPTAIPGVGSFAMFQDPSGNVVGLITEEAA